MVRSLRKALAVLGIGLCLWGLLPVPSLATAVAVTGLYWPPFPEGLNAGPPSFTSNLIDASGEKVAFLVSISKTGTLDTVGFNLGTVTTGQTLKVSFQDASATTGDPDGTVDQFRTVTVADTDDNVWKDTGLMTSDGTDGGTKRSVTIGDLVFIVIEFDSTVGNLNIRGLTFGGTRSGPVGQTYTDLFTAAWSKQGAAGPIGTLKYSDGTYTWMSGLPPVLASATTTYNNGSNPDEIALRVEFPFATQTMGACVWLDADADTSVISYDGTTAVTGQTKSIDTNIFGSTNVSPTCFYFAATETISAGAVRRLAVRPDSVTSIGFSAYTVSSATHMQAAPGGDKIYWSSRVDAGSWTDNTSQRPYACYILGQLDDGAGGAGSTVHIHISNLWRNILLRPGKPA